MKTQTMIAGFMTAAAAILISFSQTGLKSPGSITTFSPEYQWKQVAPPGSGTHQYEWKQGTYPSAIVPVVAFNGDVWMVGQKRAWSSTDGIRWEAFPKADWGERISMGYAYFNNTFWVTGGMEYATNTFLNEIWSSRDGKTWTRAVSHAEWSPRKGHTLIEFKGRLWLFGGETSVDEFRAPDEFINDIWSSGDGIHWTRVAHEAPWEVRGNPQLVVFDGKLWLIGGQGRSDIWQSEDGRTWTQLKKESPWKGRYDFGVLAYDNFIWVLGGRESEPRNAYHDVWYSRNGTDWWLQLREAPWTKRSGGFSVVFRDKLFLYGGKHTGHADGFSGDIWTMERSLPVSGGARN